MDKKDILQNYEKEYRGEIENCYITVDDLKQLGITESSISGEIYLRKIYGDEIVTEKKEETFDAKMKSNVEKIDDSDMSRDKFFRDIVKSIEESEFDQNLETLI